MQARTLRSKLVFGMAAAITLALVLVIAAGWYSMHSNGDKAVSQATAALDELVERNLLDASLMLTGEVGYLLNRSFDVSRSMSKMLSNTARGNAEGRNFFNREALRSLAGDVLASNAHLGSVYIHLEPDGYDGMDRFLAGSGLEHTSDTGVLEIYWVRDADGLQHYRTEDSNFKYDQTLNEYGIRESEWYLCSKDKLVPCLLDPYLYEIQPGQSVMLTSLVYPVLVSGEFRGVTGVDLNLPDIQARISSFQRDFYQGAAAVHLLSSEQTLVASSLFADRLGQRMQGVDAALSRALSNLELGRVVHLDSQVLILAEIKLEAVAESWLLVISLPHEVAYAASQSLQQMLLDGYQSAAFSMLITGALLMVAVISFVAFWLGIATRPMAEMQRLFADLAGADGDLTRQLKVTSHAELIGMAEGFNAFAGKLRSMVTDLKQAADELQQQGVEMDAAAQSTTAATVDQQQEMQGVASAMNEMSATAHEVARLASEAASEMDASDQLLQKTRKLLEKTVTEVREVSREMDMACQQVKAVSASSEDINLITEVIQGVAEQTNLLALNAAIEAARAGDHGRGFAVVADEVRTLAARTQSSTAEIQALIQRLREQVGQSAGQIQQSADRALKAVQEADLAWQQMEEVSASIASVKDGIVQVAAAAEEQNQVNEEMNRNINSIEQASQALGALAEEVQGVSERMAQEVDRIHGQLNQLKV